MTLSLLIKLLLFFIFIPIVYAATWAAKRWLPQDSMIRVFLLRHGVDKVARYALFAVYALSGIVLTIMYS
jgi:hypothetical protein